ncbi:MAG: AAA family ATPase [Chloroflexota bacterium]|nr:AAA family ATPase [Chloroflexota bacterium]
MADSTTEIVILGVCAAGKSTLAQRLRERGLPARTVAQEHSSIPELWRWSGASTTIYLHASYQAVKRRRVSRMSEGSYEEQLHRLRSARTDATVSVDTSELTAEEVFTVVAGHLTAEQPAPDAHEQPRPAHPDPQDAEPDRQEPPVPVAEEPGDEQRPQRYPGLPIPEEL